jgi:hypothetical protein
VARRFSPLGRRPDCLSLSREPVSFTGVHETICSPDEAIFVPGRRRPETEMRFHDQIKQWGAIMLAFILNSIYREVLRTSLSGMHKLAID